MTEQERRESWLPFQRDYRRKTLRWLLKQSQKIEQYEETGFSIIKLKHYPFDLEPFGSYGEWDVYFFRSESAEQTFNSFAAYLAKEILSSPETEVNYLRTIEIKPDQLEERALYYELGLSSKILMCRGVYSNNGQGGLSPDNDLMYALFCALSHLFEYEFNRSYVETEHVRHLEKTLLANSLVTNA